jgi:hypothetical protein
VDDDENCIWSSKRRLGVDKAKLGDGGDGDQSYAGLSLMQIAIGRSKFVFG